MSQQMKINTAPESADVLVLPGPTHTPDAEGVMHSVVLDLPAWTSATYWAAFQKYDAVDYPVYNWPDGCNRIQALRIDDFADLKEGGMFLLVRLEDGDYLCLLPLCGEATVSWFCSEGDGLLLCTGNLGTDAVEGDLPALAWARSADPYTACHEAWRVGLRHPLVGNPARMRTQKTYPEAFCYLGWCSWEEYHHKISEDVLTGAIDAIEASGLPVRFVLIDDGHFDDDDARVRSFQPNPDLFPNGWEPILRRRSPDGLRWIGLWLNFNGYWDGIAPENSFGDLNDYLTPVEAKNEKRNHLQRLLPDGRQGSSMLWYDAMVSAARGHGFDFLKIDNQAANLMFYKGGKQPVRSAARNSQAMEMACAHHMNGLINCMAHGPVCIFHTRTSAVTRCSEDYGAGKEANARRHLHNSFANTPWIGQCVWGDHDMFHSSDPVSGEMMALSKALSGGPVYLSDNPKDFVPERIHPLCDSDGKLYRPDAPAFPLPESILLNPFADGQAFRVIAPLSDGSAALVVYNLTEPVCPVDAEITPEDYTHAGGMDQPPKPWPLPEEGLVIYDWRGGTAERLDTSKSVRIEGFADAFFLLCPIRSGWAVIGRADKYLAPLAVKATVCSDTVLLLELPEPGPVRIWKEASSVQCDQADVKNLGHGLWEIRVPEGTGACRLRVSIA